MAEPIWRTVVSFTVDDLPRPAGSKRAFVITPGVADMLVGTLQLRNCLVQIVP